MAGFIPSKARNPAAAHAFLNFIMDGREGADCFEYTGYYNTYSGSDEFIKEDHEEFLLIPDGFDKNMEMIQLVSPEADEEHSRIWEAFVSVIGN
jgi:spermidine/putrescine-binding protein